MPRQSRNSSLRCRKGRNLRSENTFDEIKRLPEMITWFTIAGKIPMCGLAISGRQTLCATGVPALSNYLLTAKRSRGSPEVPVGYRQLHQETASFVGGSTRPLLGAMAPEPHPCSWPKSHFQEVQLF